MVSGSCRLCLMLIGRARRTSEVLRSRREMCADNLWGKSFEMYQYLSGNII